jgi:hypothetical protein
VWAQLQGQIYLGSESFMKQMQDLTDHVPFFSKLKNRPSAGFFPSPFSQTHSKIVS